MRHKFNPHLTLPNIRLQIQLIFIISSIVPICIFGVFAIHNARTQMLNQVESQLQTDAIRVNSTLFDITTSVVTSTSSIIDTAETRSIFDQDYTDEKYSNYNYLDSSLRNYRSNTAAISSIHIYTDNPTIPQSGYISSLVDEFEDQSWFQTISDTEYTTWYCSSDMDRFNHTLHELTLVQRLPLSTGQYRAFLVTRLDSNYIRNRLLNNEHLIFASIDDGNIFFSSNRAYIDTSMPAPKDEESPVSKYTGPIDIEHTSLLSSIVTFQPYKTNRQFHILVCDLNAYPNINRITTIYMIILLFATLVPAVLILFFSTYFSNRIQTLKRAMHQASVGDYNIIEQFHGDDELADTFHDLKTTVDLIHQKEAQFYEAQISEQQLLNTQQQMEFKMLASQINPHFLYNTLETIRMQAISSGNREVADSIHLLGRSMHYVLENTGTDSTTIAKELGHVLTYLKIQQLRFQDRVNYDIQVPPYLDLERFRILPLLLQPIVENAIIHGLEGVTQNGHVEIALILEEPNLYITVHDNGEGMDELTASRLQQSISSSAPETTSGSIGLRNINNRMLLMYGSDYGLKIQSAPKSGTTVTLTFPLKQMIGKQNLEDILAKREQYWNLNPDDLEP